MIKTKFSSSSETVCNGWPFSLARMVACSERHPSPCPFREEGFLVPRDSRAHHIGTQILLVAFSERDLCHPRGVSNNSKGAQLPLKAWFYNHGCFAACFFISGSDCRASKWCNTGKKYVRKSCKRAFLERCRKDGASVEILGNLCWGLLSSQTT